MSTDRPGRVVFIGNIPYGRLIALSGLEKYLTSSQVSPKSKSRRSSALLVKFSASVLSMTTILVNLKALALQNSQIQMLQPPQSGI